MFEKAHNKVDGPLRNNYTRDQYYKKSFSYIKPVRMSLGNQNNESKFYYIPIFKTLKNLLSDTGVYNQCVKTSNKYDGLIFPSGNISCGNICGPQNGKLVPQMP